MGSEITIKDFIRTDGVTAILPLSGVRQHLPVYIDESDPPEPRESAVQRTRKPHAAISMLGVA